MMEDYQTSEHVKEEVVDCGFVDVDSQDVHQLCTACLCATRTTHTLSDGALKQYYMHILTEIQPEGGVVLQSPRVCWECVSHLKRSVRFREQVQDSYRLLLPMLSMCDKEDLDEFLQTSVCRPERLKACLAFSINIAPQDDDAQVMTVTKHGDDDDDAGASECLDINIERHFAVPEEIVATIKEESIESFCDDNEGIITCVREDLIESPLMNSQGHVNNEQSEKPGAHTRTEVMKDIKTIYTPNSTHESTEDVNTTLVCDYCYKRLNSKAALERHIATYNIYPHTNKTVPSPCADCAVVLCSDDQCSECPNKLNLLQHNNMDINMKKVHHQCRVCHKSFPLKGNLLRHKRTHTGEKPFQSEVCHKSFSRKHHLMDHLRTHTGEKGFQRKVCHKSFSNQSGLASHIKTHSGEKPFQCKVCRRSFSRKDYLMPHLRTHTGEKPYQCDMCHKSFSQKNTLKDHLRTHTGEKPFQCKVCHKSFLYQSGLASHIKTHSGEKPFQCKVCRRSFSRKHSLMLHLRTHTGEKPFQCEVCHKSFSLNSTLVRHIKTHTGEKSFPCEVCHKSFLLKHHLRDHLRTHTGEKPFQCKVCHKSFSRKDYLMLHLRTHTGEIPYQCEMCNKSFSFKSNLAKHIKTHAVAR